MVKRKYPRRNKLEVDGNIIEQVMNFNHQGIKITGTRNLTNRSNKTNNRSRKSGYVNETIWRDKFITTKSQMKV